MEEPVSHTRRIAGAAALVMTLLAAAKVVGVVDDLVKARVFGTSADLDAFIAANGLPELLNVVISGGALAAPFIPVLVGHLNQNDQEGAWGLASSVINLAFLTTAALAALVALLAPWLVAHLIAPGFTPEQQALTAGLMRLTLVSTLIFAVSGVVMSILHAYQHFLFPALAPTFYNLGIIGGAVLLAEPLGVWGLAVGAIVGSAMHLLIQLPKLRSYGARWQPSLGLDNPSLRRVLGLMGPRVLTLGVIQLNLLLSVRLASDLVEGSVSALNYGYRLMQMPETIIGTAIATAAFPTLSELAKSGPGAADELRRTFSVTLRVVLTLSLPAALGLALLGRPFIELLFRGGEFGNASTEAVLAAVQGYALALVGQAALEVVSRVFFAREDTLTPLLAAAAAMGVSLGLGLALRGPLGVLGLALASSLGVTFEVVVLLWQARRPLGGVEEQQLLRSLTRILLATGAMGVALLGLNAVWPLSTDDLLRQALYAASAVGLGGLIYLSVGLLIGLPEIRPIARVFKARLSKREIQKYGFPLSRE